jgi:hypothetical protein
LSNVQAKWVVTGVFQSSASQFKNQPTHSSQPNISGR